MIVTPEERAPPTNSGASSEPKGEAAADLVVRAEPRARRDIAADAPAIGRALADAHPRDGPPQRAQSAVAAGKAERSNSPALASSDGPAMRKARSGAQASSHGPFHPAPHAGLTVNYRWPE